jgi:hypothetical protein
MAANIAATIVCFLILLLMPSFIFSSPFDFCFAGDHKICLGTKSFHGTKNPQLAASKHFGEPCSFAGSGG